MLRDPASYTDPNGFVYWQGEAVYRRIHAAAAPFIETLLGHPAFVAMAQDGRLVGATLASRDEQGLVLSHERVAPASYPQEWCAPMLEDAAALVLDVAQAAAEAGYGLADGHPWNVFFDGPRPRFLDWGSFTVPSATLLWPAQAQFDRFLRYPLHLYAAGQGELARARLADLALGVTPELALRTLGAGYLARRPRLTAGLYAHQLAVRLTSDTRQTSAKTPGKAPKAGVLQQLRPGYFRGLARDLRGLGGGVPQGQWARYYAECPSMEAAEEAAKLALLERVLTAEKPATVLDLGANTGKFSVLAARLGARVTAIDQDPTSVGLLYRQAAAEKLDVLPLVMDLGNPTPATGWNACQRPDAWDRLQSDGTLALALLHHLVFTGNHDFAQVAQLLRRVTRRFAVVEWIAPEDAMARFLTRTSTKDFAFYTLDHFEAALATAGLRVERLTPHASTRQLLLLRT